MTNMPIKAEKPTLLFCGYARLPANAGVPNEGGSLAIELEIDPYDMRIVDTGFSAIPSLGQKFLTNILVGCYIEEGLDKVMAEIRHRYFSVTQRALIAALEDLQRQYRDSLDKAAAISEKTA